MSDNINEVHERLRESLANPWMADSGEYASARTTDLRALLADHARLQANVEPKAAVEQQDTTSYWRVSFRMYEDDSDLCVLFVEGAEVPNLDTLGVAPRPYELVSADLRHTQQHRWDAYGERCLDCGDKDWMNDPKCRPIFDTRKAVQP